MTKKEIIDGVINDLPTKDCRYEMSSDEWYGWFEEVYDKATKQKPTQLIDIQKELPPINEDVFFIGEDGMKGIVCYEGKDQLYMDTMYSRVMRCSLGIVAFKGHWIKE